MISSATRCAVSIARPITRRRSKRSACSRSSGCSASRTRIAARSSSTPRSKATASNGASPMKSVVAAFSLARQVHGDKGEWNAAARSRGRRARARRRRGAAVRRDPVRSHRVRQDERHRAREEVLRDRRVDRAAEPERAGLHLGRGRPADGSGLDADDPRRRRTEPVAAAAPEPVVEAKPTKGKRSKRNSAANIAAPVEEAKPVETKPMAVDASMPTPVVEDVKSAPTPLRPSSLRMSRPSRCAVEAKPAAAVDVPADLDAAMQKAKAAEGGAGQGRRRVEVRDRGDPSNPLPRRELARVLRGAASWAQLVDALKDEEAKAASTPAEKAAVFVELAEAYGKLNNDNQVIASLTQAIHHDPSMMDAYDKLAAPVRDQEAVAGSRQGARREGRAHRRRQRQGRDLPPDREPLPRALQQPGRGDQGVREGPRARSEQPARPSITCSQVYEKRRDWEKLIKLKEAEVERSPDAERAREGDRGRAAWPRPRSRSPTSARTGGRRLSSTSRATTRR